MIKDPVLPALGIMVAVAGLVAAGTVGLEIPKSVLADLQPIAAVVATGIILACVVVVLLLAVGASRGDVVQGGGGDE